MENEKKETMKIFNFRATSKFLNDVKTAAKDRGLTATGFVKSLIAREIYDK